MWSGIYGKYPDEAYLTQADKKQLWRSPFFSTTRANASTHLAHYTHARGAFERRRMAAQTYWIEYDARGEPVFTFEEIAREGDRVLALDRGRRFTLSLNLQGGPSRISTDGGQTWGALYTLRRR